MARKQAIAIQETIDNNEDLLNYIANHSHQLICMEVYSEFCGPCLATAFAVRKGKLDIGQDRIAMVRCPADHIDVLSRFKDKSEPVFLFLVDGMLTRSMFGPNGLELCRIIQEELDIKTQEEQGIVIDRPRLNIDEMLPEEAAKQKELQKFEDEYREASERLRVLTLAARKKRVNERLAKNLKRLNFILYWPHCHHAHIDLYEKWDMINITVYGKEMFQLDERSAKEALYMSDVDPNEACLHALMEGKVLVVLFKMFETDTRDFVKLLRYTLYEEIPEPKEDTPPEKQLPPIPAYERYATISKSAREIRRERYNAKLEKMRLEEEERLRLEAEQERLVREAAEEEARLEKQRQEEARMARIAAGLPPDPEPEPEPEPVPEEVVEAASEEPPPPAPEDTPMDDAGSYISDLSYMEMEGETEPTEFVEGEVPQGEGETEEKEAEDVFHSDVSIEGEDYIPPGGLFVPGLYSPPNELAKANGLAFFYPKQVISLCGQIETEYLPPHVLVIFPAEKRHEVQEIIKQYPTEILNIGFFDREDPYTAEHLAYSIKHYDKIDRPIKRNDRLALMVSRKRSLTLLQLAGLNPVYISSDIASGERECLSMFPVGYGDDYEDEPSIVSEPEVEPEEEKKEEEEVVPPVASGVLPTTASTVPLSSSMMPVASSMPQVASSTQANQ